MPEKTEERNWSVTFEITKIDKEERLVHGWAVITSDENGIPIVDSDDHIIPTIELQKAVHDAFMQSSGVGKVGDMHEKSGIGDVVNTVIVTKKLRESAPEVFSSKGPEGWFTSFYVRDDEVWEKVKSGERPELSMRGTATGVAL